MPKGGAFICSQTSLKDVFIPEEFDNGQKMIYRTTLNFVNNEILPKMEEIEAQNEDVIRGLVRYVGKLGLIGASVPEQYGGTEMDKISYTIIAECMGRSGSFNVLFGAQATIGTLPIAFFGNEEQKKRYLPKLVSGEKISAYALTESGAGSDAMSIKTRAVLSTDGRHYIINGTKQFISNSGIADVFILFAKVDGEKFTAFIIDASSEGLSTGPEEKKMGLKGSSTRALVLDNVKVPVENVLFDVGRGYVPAFNLLNIGRGGVGAGSLGIAKYAL